MVLLYISCTKDQKSMTKGPDDEVLISQCGRLMLKDLTSLSVRPTSCKFSSCGHAGTVHEYFTIGNAIKIERGATAFGARLRHELDTDGQPDEIWDSNLPLILNSQSYQLSVVESSKLS